jgi:hypothetical protein
MRAPAVPRTTLAPITPSPSETAEPGVLDTAWRMGMLPERLNLRPLGRARAAA